MKTKQEIKQKLKEVYDHRLKLRYKKYLSKSCRNCQNSQLVITDKHKLFICVGKKSSRNNIVVCDNNTSICESFNNRNTKQSVERDFLKELKNPKLCGQTEPKIAVLLWVLTSENNIQSERELFKESAMEQTLWKKLKKLCGLVSR